MKMKNRNRNITQNIMFRIVVLGIVVLLMIYIMCAMYFKTHFYIGTTINGVNCSAKTIEEVKVILNSATSSYQLELKERGDKSEYIDAESIELKTMFDKTLETALVEQNPYAWIRGFYKKDNYEIPTMLYFNEEALTEVLSNLACFDSENITKPKDAYIEFSKSSYVIIDAEYGNQVEKNKLQTLVIDAINSLQPSISLEDTNCYIQPLLRADSKQLLTTLETLNKYVGTTITYYFGDKSEVVDATIIHNWIETDDDFNININKDKVKEYVDYIGYTYNTFGMKREFQTSYGEAVTVSGGDYGWWLNRTLEVEELIELVKKGENLTKEPTYYQKAAKYGKDDIGNTYVELNLLSQHLFFYKDGELVIESDFVSGNPSKNNATPVGTYSITYKEREATLVGEDYSSPVTYWMPFNQNIGLHDAKWRKKFGGEIYLKNGSHGCINLPYESAEIIYENIEKGIPVICYELEVIEEVTEEVTEEVIEEGIEEGIEEE